MCIKNNASIKCLNLNLVASFKMFLGGWLVSKHMWNVVCIDKSFYDYTVWILSWANLLCENNYDYLVQPLSWFYRMEIIMITNVLGFALLLWKVQRLAAR